MDNFAGWTNKALSNKWTQYFALKLFRYLEIGQGEWVRFSHPSHLIGKASRIFSTELLVKRQQNKLSDKMVIRNSCK